ncbi:hypothetical protein WG66_011568 [Moniliophthora roreri]|nr:hypothetical protein WG66_011568 [Moniliophthora roreri]
MNEVRESQKPLLGPLSTTPNASSEADIGSRRLGIRPLTQMQTETWVPTRTMNIQIIDRPVDWIMWLKVNHLDLPSRLGHGAYFVLCLAIFLNKAAPRSNPLLG